MLNLSVTSCSKCTSNLNSGYPDMASATPPNTNYDRDQLIFFNPIQYKEGIGTLNCFSSPSAQFYDVMPLRSLHCIALPPSIVSITKASSVVAKADPVMAFGRHRDRCRSWVQERICRAWLYDLFWFLCRRKVWCFCLLIKSGEVLVLCWGCC